MITWYEALLVGIVSAFIVTLGFKRESPVWYVRLWLVSLGETNEPIVDNPPPLPWYRWPGLYISRLASCGLCQSVVLALILSCGCRLPYASFVLHSLLAAAIAAVLGYSGTTVMEVVEAFDYPYEDDPEDSDDARLFAFDPSHHGPGTDPGTKTGSTAS